MNIVRKYLISLLCLIATFAACTNDNPDNFDARLRINLTDAASITLKELNLNINRIEAFTTSEDDATGKWIELEHTPNTYNLLQYTNGKTVKIVDQFFPSGQIKAIRIYFGTSSNLLIVTETANVSEPLIISDELQTQGFAYETDITIQPNTISTAIIDINAARSVVTTNEQFVFNPVIRAFASNYGGSLKGFVNPVGVGAYVMVTQEPDTLITLPEAADGMFQFLGLKPGACDVYVIPFDDQYEMVAFSDTIVERQVKTAKINPVKLTPKTDEDNDEDETEENGD